MAKKLPANDMHREMRQIISRRRRLIRIWPVIALLLGVVSIGFYVWAFLQNPILVNPLHVLDLMQTGNLDSATQALLAVTAPMLFLAVGLLVLLLLAFVTAGLVSEGRLMRVLEKNLTR
jgi:polyferredoxin